MIESNLFRALGDPTRRAVYERLSAREMNVADLKAGLPISQPAVSQHLAALKLAGLVSERRDGRRTFYRTEPEGLRPMIDWMARTGAFWPERIERLKDLLRRMDQ
ncbi:MAG TPA: metalloregulator ArsR/SmtB family transcription factor [Caulobacteraceae bacterium]|jgi:DNA-binding transcriptional ArsR family regulator